MGFITTLSKLLNGLTADDGTGTSLRSGADIINDNSDTLVSVINQLAASQGSSLKPFATKADLIAAQAGLPVGTVAVVWNDPTPANNIPYVWDGTTLNPSFDRPTYLMLSALGNVAGFQQIGSGSLLRSFQDKGRDHFNVFDLFTAAQKADALTGAPAIDTTSVIQNALDNASAMGQRCVAYGVFRVSSKITIKGDADFSQATFLVYGTPAIAVELSTGNASNPTTNLLNATVWLPKRIQNMTKPGVGWATQGIGVRTVNCYSCNVHTGNIYGFAIGFQATSFGTGNVYNEYHIGHLENNQINLDLQPGNSTGWVNENNIYGGRYSHVSGEGTNAAGTRHIRISKAASIVNNNVFYKPSIEGDVAEYHVENGGSFNTIIQGRWEATTPKVLYTADNTNQATRNLILNGYKVEGIVFTLTGASGFENTVIGARGSIYNGGDPTGNLKFQNTNSSSAPIFKFFNAATYPETAGANDYSVSFSSQRLAGKLKGDAFDRIYLDFTAGRLFASNGIAAATAWVGNVGAASMGTNADWLPATSGTLNNGSSSQRWINTYSKNIVLSPPASATPSTNGDMTFQLTNDTTLVIKVKGSDGTVRSATLTLA